MKQNCTFVMLLLILLGLSACSSHNKTIDGKYVSIYNESSYLIFNKDGSFENSLWNITNNGATTIDDRFIYTIDEDRMITAIDTTEYEGQDSLNEYEIGILYKDYICILWYGILPINHTNTTVKSTIGDLTLIFNFKEDKSYEYTVINNEIVHTENGTYTVNDNEVVCTSQDGVITTFVSIEDKVFCIEYVKE